MKLDVGYPDAAEEIALLKLERKGLSDSGLDRIKVVVSAEELASLAAAVDAVTVADQILSYTSAIVRRTRTLPSVELGASPRAAVHLLAAAKATAVFAGRSFVTPDDVLGVAEDVLRHRLILRPEAEIDRYTPEAAVRAAIAAVPVPK
jgi:MoxR-like ATPase